MSLSHASYTFGAIETHGVPECGPWAYEDTLGKFYGVVGASELRDFRKDREITITADFTGYASFALLETDMRALDAKINVLTGTLTVMGTTYENCTFKGFRRTEPAFLDGSGVNGWIQRGVLHWLQLKPNA